MHDRRTKKISCLRFTVIDVSIGVTMTDLKQLVICNIVKYMLVVPPWHHGFTKYNVTKFAVTGISITHCKFSSANGDTAHRWRRKAMSASLEDVPNMMKTTLCVEKNKKHEQKLLKPT